MRVVEAVTTIPDRRAWARCGLVYGVFLLCAFPFGLATGLLRPGVPHAPATTIVIGSLVALVHPAFVEELIFRAVLLPRNPATMRGAKVVSIAALALALYVASHPLNAIIFRPDARAVFESPAYLAVVSMLGLACTVAYWVSRSIWPPVTIHWLTVVLWLWLLGGQALLSGTIART